MKQIKLIFHLSTLMWFLLFIPLSLGAKWRILRNWNWQISLWIIDTCCCLWNNKKNVLEHIIFRLLSRSLVTWSFCKDCFVSLVVFSIHPPTPPQGLDIHVVQIFQFDSNIISYNLKNTVHHFELQNYIIQELTRISKKADKFLWSFTLFRFNRKTKGQIPFATHC